MNAFNITISSRLKNHAVAQTLAELGTDISHITLRRGDFVLGGRFGIKFYTDREFIQAVRDRSIYREVLELKREFSDPIIIVKGEHPFDDPQVSLATIHGAVLFASVANRVPILTTRNDMETAQMIFMMAAQTGDSKDWQMAMASTVGPQLMDGEDLDPRINLIAELPEVGPTLAQGLLKHFGSLSRLFAAKITDLRKVEGIGAKKAEKIHAFLNGHQAA
jgi:ERCC4-type nuclease